MKRTGIHQSRGIIKQNQKSGHVSCPVKIKQSKQELQDFIDNGLKEYNNQFKKTDKS